MISKLDKWIVKQRHIEQYLTTIKKVIAQCVSRKKLFHAIEDAKDFCEVCVADTDDIKTQIKLHQEHKELYDAVIDLLNFEIKTFDKIVSEKVKAEREACAKACEDSLNFYFGYVGSDFAKLIRDRSIGE